MKTINVHSILAAFISLLLGACNSTVTNYGTEGKKQTLQEQVTTVGPSSQADSGGVINGGGGKGVRCAKNGKTTIEVLDLYEAKNVYNLSLKDFGQDEESAKDLLAATLARHFWNPHTIEISEYSKVLKKLYVEDVIQKIQFLSSDKKLKVTNDSHEPLLENNCEIVQIAMYYDESVLLVDRSLWDQMDQTNKMGLLAHEALYFLARQQGTKNSMSTRKLVGMLFSSQGAKPLAEGAPSSTRKFMECRLSNSDFYKGHFYLYESQDQNKKRSLEALFFNLGNDGTLFRTSAVFSGLSLTHLRLPEFNGERQSYLIKESYPVRDRVNLKFKGIQDRRLTAELKILRGANNAETDIFDVDCNLPPKVEDLEAGKTSSRKFVGNAQGAETDRLEIFSDGTLLLEMTRQVGSADSLEVPYPTVCRYKEHGFIDEELNGRITYTLTQTVLSDLTGLTDTSHCTKFIESRKKREANGSLSYTIYTAGFTELPQSSSPSTGENKP